VSGCVQRAMLMDSQTLLSMFLTLIIQAAHLTRFLCRQRTFSALPVFPVCVIAVAVFLQLEHTFLCLSCDRADFATDVK